MIFVCPLSQLERTVAACGARRVLTLIADGAVVERPANVAPADHLALRFHDIAEPRAGLVAPTAGMVEEALAFAAADDGPLVVHCYAGVSRSTAMAYAIACAREPGRDESELADELRRLSPTATPNRLIVALADAALARAGRMSAAIARIGRGEETFEGEPFALRLAGVRA
ncbi:tyrosine phosphatase family protein [Methylopila turkensis]|uniref:Protein-tyrosine-phosphatase n=1 Tax=Methylopila turkensis TaxID=1437816 RepID=A0A9W6N8L6_9HYPH|nr:protein tyrosine phosphatase [Methylopila turkensis]GLK81521.1 protein-tyrosine-phosphatase [Methylopila turkensis]